MVVLMTSETLKRMWCAAEIACAWHAATNIAAWLGSGDVMGDLMGDFMGDFMGGVILSDFL